RLFAYCNLAHIGQPQNRQQLSLGGAFGSVNGQGRRLGLLFICPLRCVPLLVWNVVCGRKTLQASDLRLGGWRHKRLEALLEVGRHHAFVEEETQWGKSSVVSIVLARLPHGGTAVLRLKPIRQK